jgi:prophage antirepressor-like protein
MESTKTGRENYQLVPFIFENHTIRAVVIKNDPWFVVRDVCDTLGLTNHRKAVGDLSESEKEVTTGYTPGGKRTWRRP